jgi:hypothetical protein
MLGRSFRSLARLVFPRVDARKLAPFVLAVALAGCGGSAKEQVAGKRVNGTGFSFEAPADWRVSRGFRTVEARAGDALVSVTVFRLARPYRPADWHTVVPELDRVAHQLATRAQGKVEDAETRPIAGRDARAYAISRSGADERIAFVLDGRREYQLFCRGAGDACDRLLDSFTLSA